MLHVLRALHACLPVCLSLVIRRRRQALSHIAE